MKIDWKKKLTSRKFWAAVCGFVSMLILALGKDSCRKSGCGSVCRRLP